MRTITLTQLQSLVAEAITTYGKDARVVFTADYGDYGHTPQALPLTGEYEQAVIATSGYSQSGWRVTDAPVAIEDDEDVVVVIK